MTPHLLAAAFAAFASNLFDPAEAVVLGTGVTGGGVTGVGPGFCEREGAAGAGGAALDVAEGAADADGAGCAESAGGGVGRSAGGVMGGASGDAGAVATGAGAVAVVNADGSEVPAVFGGLSPRFRNSTRPPAPRSRTTMTMIEATTTALLFFSGSAEGPKASCAPDATCCGGAP